MSQEISHKKTHSNHFYVNGQIGAKRLLIVSLFSWEMNFGLLYKNINIYNCESLTQIHVFKTPLIPMSEKSFMIFIYLMH